MAIHLIPLAVGTAVVSAAAYLFKNPEVRHHIADDSRRLGHSISDYVTGLFAGGETARTEIHSVEQAQGPDLLRCEALTKGGQRCRAGTHKVVTFPNAAGDDDEHGLCWRHARVFEAGDPLELAEPAEPAAEAPLH